MHKIKRSFTTGSLVALLLITGVLFGFQSWQPVQAAAIIEVNSTADTMTASDGECTLREAIINANNDSDGTGGDCTAGSGADTINFNLSGTADFTNASQDGYTISPASPLPAITEQVTIDGFSQADSAPNSTASPQPFDAVLLIEIDGSNTTINTGSCLKVENADGTIIKGLTINNCANHGIEVENSNNVTIQGNYIGTNPQGTSGEGAGRNYSSGPIANGILAVASNHLKIGGTAAAERNIIAASQTNDVWWHNEADDANPSSDNVLQGNYIGLAANGTTPLPAGYVSGVGNAVLIGNSQNDLIGGTTSGARNVIASSAEYGVGTRDAVTGLVIQSNYIGTDYTGSAAVTHTYGTGHPYAGIHIGVVSNAGFTNPPHNIDIGGTTASARNIISGNTRTGGFTPGVLMNDDAYDVRVRGNYIGTDAAGTAAVPNQIGVSFDTFNGHPTYDNIIGGTVAGAGNVISGNIYNGVVFSGEDTYDNLLQGNRIGTAEDGTSDLGNDEEGVRVQNAAAHNIIGGTASGAGNIIAFNGSNGVNVVDDGSSASIISNSLFSNTGLGIKLGFGTGVTANDSGDVDSGPNNLLNYPDPILYWSYGGDTYISYDLDVPAGNYRVEFYSNPSADSSGHGEGKTLIGSQNITSGGLGAQGYITNFVATGLTNIVATVTQVTTGFSGFGSTSEFSTVAQAAPPVNDIALSKTLTNPEDVSPGAELHYAIEVANTAESTNAIDLSQSNNSAPGVNSLFIDLLPPQLTFISVTTPDISCITLPATAFGPNSMSSGDHASYNLILCGFTGASPTMLNPNESITIDLVATVNPGVDTAFTNYVVGGIVSSDPDLAGIGGVFGSGTDIIDGLTATPYNNFASAAYMPTPPEEPGNNSGGGNNNGQSNAGTSSPLGTTGQATLVVLPLVLLWSSLAMLRHIKRRTASYRHRL